MGGYLYNSCYVTYQAESKLKLLIDVDVFGITAFGDGATVVKTLLVNVLAEGVYESAGMRDIIDCTDHMSAGRG